METDSKPTILVVDEDPSTRCLLRDWLEESDYTLIEAGDGVTALETLGAASELIDTLILDQQMPRKDGLTVLREMRADPVSASCRSSCRPPSMTLIMSPPVSRPVPATIW